MFLCFLGCICFWQLLVSVSNCFSWLFFIYALLLIESNDFLLKIWEQNKNVVANEMRNKKRRKHCAKIYLFFAIATKKSIHRIEQWQKIGIAQKVRETEGEMWGNKCWPWNCWTGDVFFAFFLYFLCGFSHGTYVD